MCNINECTLARVLNWVSKVDWLLVVEGVFKQCYCVINELIEELEQRCPLQEIMNDNAFFSHFLVLTTN
jgi:hypothetical protein